MPKITTGISIDSEIFKRAKKAAQDQRRSFSNYLEGLIEVDQRPVITNSHQNVGKRKIVRRAKR